MVTGGSRVIICDEQGFPLASATWHFGRLQNLQKTQV